MVSAEERPSFLQRHRKASLGCVAALVVCGLVVLSLALFARSMRAGVASAVETAVRATFPGFCAAAGDRMTIQPRSLPISLIPNRYWDIRCDPGSEWTGPAMTIDAQACSVLVPQYGVLEWPMVYGTMIEDGEPLAVCP